VAVERADRFWPSVTRLVVAILIVLFILSVILYVFSQTLRASPGG
jgi:uncharacterized membrane protein